MKYLVIFAFLMILPFAHAACLTSSDEYAVEVVVPNYTIFGISQFAQIKGTSYQTLSQYSPKLLAQFKESKDISGLDIRIQIPTKSTQIRKPYTRLVSFSVPGTIRSSGASTFAGWSGVCNDITCAYDKNNVRVTGDRSSNQVIVEFNMELPACSSSCLGTCFAGPKESKCLALPIKRDLDQIVRYLNASSTFDPLLQSYRSGDSDYLLLDDIAPIESVSTDWREAIKQELVFLDARGIVSISPSDIQSISSIASQGLAGHNHRIVYDSSDNSWKQYSQANGSTLTTDIDCSTYTLPIIKEPAKLKTYYLIPLILIIFGLVLLIILVITARIVSHNRKHVRKKI